VTGLWLFAEHTGGSTTGRTVMEPLRISFEVGRGVEHVFEVWTAR
jgi:hypothetical protein